MPEEQFTHFSWDDVDRCRRAAEDCEATRENEHNGINMFLYEEELAWENLAARIASFLNPRE